MLVVLQRFGEAELHPPSLGDEAQSTVSADVIKPSAGLKAFCTSKDHCPFAMV